MLEELIEHVDDGRRATWKYSLPGAPSVNFLDQLWLDSDVDICGFSFHGESQFQPSVPEIAFLSAASACCFC